MNRTMRAAAVAAILTSGLGSIGCVNTGTSGCSSGGCGGGAGGPGARGEGHGPIGDHWRNWVDPSYPERYNFAARESVVAPFAQQAANGHFLNQTVWNYYFETGTDRLTPAGIEKLDSLARTRPAPDPKIYIQTAHDIPTTPENVDKIIDVRAELDSKRAAAIQKYMGTQLFASGAVAVYVHNAPVPSMNSDMALRAYNGSILQYRGGVSGAGTGVLGTGGQGNLTTAPGAGGGGGTGTGTVPR
jgi:hypothetical protein